jgi:hypothetical protein
MTINYAIARSSSGKPRWRDYCANAEVAILLNEHVAEDGPTVFEQRPQDLAGTSLRPCSREKPEPAKRLDDRPSQHERRMPTLGITFLSPANQRPEPPGPSVWIDGLLDQAELPSDSLGKFAVLEIDGTAAAITNGLGQSGPSCGVRWGGEMCVEQCQVVSMDAFGLHNLECSEVVGSVAKLLVVHVGCASAV